MADGAVTSSNAIVALKNTVLVNTIILYNPTLVQEHKTSGCLCYSWEHPHCLHVHLFNILT